MIVLGMEKKARLLLIDELTGRKVAESLDLHVMGSVDLLMRAKQIGAIPAVKPLLEGMIQQGMFFSQKFIDAVLRKLEEKSEQ